LRNWQCMLPTKPENSANDRFIQKILKSRTAMLLEAISDQSQIPLCLRERSSRVSCR
jgi:hypothetical protein